MRWFHWLGLAIVASAVQLWGTAMLISALSALREAQQDFIADLSDDDPDARQQWILQRLRPLADRALAGDVTAGVQCGIAVDDYTKER